MKPAKRRCTTSFDKILPDKLDDLSDYLHTNRIKSLKLRYHRDKTGDGLSSNINNVSATPENSNKNYYTNCDASIWMRSCQQEVIEPLQGEITGVIPKWLRGTLLRNGPGNLKVGEHTFQHLFDSSALLHRFEISDGIVTYQSRFVQTDVFKRNIAAQRIVVSEFGTGAMPDPCQSIFHRVASMFTLRDNISDNTMISVYPLGDEYYTFTESAVMHRIDPKTLETLGKLNMSDYVNIVNHSSHPHIMADGTVYNVGLSITPLGPKYNIVSFHPSRVIIDENREERELSMFDQATIVASVPCRWLLNPSYMHTFGITENYFIIVEQPLALSLFGILTDNIRRKPMHNSIKWHQDEDTLIHVISRKTGQVVRTFVAEAFFFLHFINQFETRDKEYVVLDICCYRDAKMLDCMYANSMKTIHENPDYANMFRGRPLRFVLPMKLSHFDTSTETNLIRLKTAYQSLESFQNIDDESIDRKIDFEIITDVEIVESNIDNVKRKEDNYSNALRIKPIAHRLPNGNIFVKPELLCDLGCETPRLNTDSYVGREYRYFYAISCDVDLDNPGTIIKVDTLRKSRKTWNETDIYPSEPIFVADPNGKNEDDGIIVSSLVWGQKYETKVGLLILNAVTFTEIARATFETPGPVPKCLHGWFTLNK